MPWPPSEVPNQVSSTRPDAIENRLHDAIVIPGIRASPKVPKLGKGSEKRGGRGVSGRKEAKTCSPPGHYAFPTGRERAGPESQHRPAPTQPKGLAVCGKARRLRKGSPSEEGLVSGGGLGDGLPVRRSPACAIRPSASGSKLATTQPSAVPAVWFSEPSPPHVALLCRIGASCNGALGSDTSPPP